MSNEKPSSSFPYSLLAGLRFPQLFLVLGLLFLINLFVPDPIPLIDEGILGVLTLMLGLWRKTTPPQPPYEPPERPYKPPEKNVTPQDD